MKDKPFDFWLSDSANPQLMGDLFTVGVRSLIASTLAMSDASPRHTLMVDEFFVHEKEIASFGQQKIVGNVNLNRAAETIVQSIERRSAEADVKMRRDQWSPVKWCLNGPDQKYRHRVENQFPVLISCLEKKVLEFEGQQRIPEKLSCWILFSQIYPSGHVSTK